MPEVDTFNKYMVSARGDSIIIQHNGPLLREGLKSKADAFNLAAWIVAMAAVLPGEEKFADVLTAVENT